MKGKVLVLIVVAVVLIVVASIIFAVLQTFKSGEAGLEQVDLLLRVVAPLQWH